MKILLNFDYKNTKNLKSLGGIETLNYNFFKKIKNKYKNLKIEIKNNSKFYNIIISSNDATVFDQYKSQKNILWLHNKLQLEKAFRKKQLFSILKNEITAVFVSKYLNDITSKLYNFKRRIVIPNFLDERFENLKINNIRKPLIIWSVSREKGLKETLLLWSNYIHKYHPRAEFHIFGIKKKNLKKYRKENIYFHGRVSKNVLIKYYNKSIASICLGYDETFCLNAIESMSCGVPVLSFKKTALLSLIRENINGFKVDNFFELKNKINELILLPNIKRKKLIATTYKFSKKYYFKEIENKWLSIISK